MPEPQTVMLVVEDDPTVAGSLASYFADYEYRVITATDAAAGLGLFTTHRPAIVLVDLNLPGEGDGFDVMRYVREQDPELPLLIISGTGGLDDVIQALRMGAWDYMTKPISDLSLLRYSVNRAMERAQLLRENRRHRENLERQIRERTAQLEAANLGLEQKNLAMREVLAAIESEKSRISERVANNIEKAVLPMLASLRPGLNDDQQRKLDQVERSLSEIASPLVDRLTREVAQLTPMELRVAILIRRGLSIKEIAAMEQISPDTVATHRRSIRRKLGITNSKLNLVSYLQTCLSGEDGEGLSTSRDA